MKEYRLNRLFNATSKRCLNVAVSFWTNRAEAHGQLVLSPVKLAR